MKALLIAAGTGLAAGILAGAALKLSSSVPAEPVDGFQTAALAEDPGVALHREAMGAESWAAPAPYIPVTYPSVDYQPEVPPLADLALADIRIEASLEPIGSVDGPNAAEPEAVAGAAETARPLQIAAAPLSVALDTTAAPR